MTNEIIDDLTHSRIESIEIRPVNNGFLVTTRTEDDEGEFVFDSHQKTLRFVKKLVSPSK